MAQRKRKQYRPPCWGKGQYNNGHDFAFRDAGLGLKEMKECYCTICNGTFYRLRVNIVGKVVWRENNHYMKPPRYHRK